jgi:hypothetical protein
MVIIATEMSLLQKVVIAAGMPHIQDYDRDRNVAPTVFNRGKNTAD